MAAFIMYFGSQRYRTRIAEFTVTIPIQQAAHGRLHLTHHSKPLARLKLLISKKVLYYEIVIEYLHFFRASL